jgi:hypothetical protein
MYTDMLLARVSKAYQRLKHGGWDVLFKAHGLDLDAEDLKSELLRPLPNINREMRGFEDFAYEGQRGIEPGQPARSLLYHALASPNVTHGPDGMPLKVFPTPVELEAAENLVYGLVTPSIQELRVRANGAPMALVVFASEYRPAFETVHQKHADVCFSRVGVARVGTAAHHYVPSVRGYLPFNAKKSKAIRVLPCRYAAYVAVHLHGQFDRFGPMHFQTTPKSDAERDFWVPLHKVFSGAECLRELNLTLTLKASHINEKLRRAHRVLAGLGYDTGWHEPNLEKEPFVFHDGIAAFSTNPDDGEGLLVPTVHKALVEKAEFNSKTLTYLAPKNREPFRSSVIIDSKPSGTRTAPEYVHVRHRMEKDGTITDLNTLPNMLDLIKEGGYEAVHYLDYTGEGFIEAECPELALELPQILGAYSMVGAVDFFPLVKQHELIQWWQQSAPPELEGNIWPSNPGPPLALSDTRFAANPTMTLDKLTVNEVQTQHNQPRPAFELTDDTMSAIVGLLDSGNGKLTQVNDNAIERTSSLSDGASGVFAPGWDTSIDRTDEEANEDGSIKPGVTYFNNYGLGSPFPEDAMLCAALSAYWPAAAPDITRTFAPGSRYATATPLTDDQLGLTGQDPWDGIKGPVIPDANCNEVEYRQIVYGDYVQAALDSTFNISTIARTTTREYIARTLVMARAYSALGAVTREQKREWALLSFMPVKDADTELQTAERQANAKLNRALAYRFKIFRHQPINRKPTDHRNQLVGFDKMLTLYADPQCVLLQDDGGDWNARRY